MVTWKRDYVDTEEKEVSRLWTPGGWELKGSCVFPCLNVSAGTNLGALGLMGSGLLLMAWGSTPAALHLVHSHTSSFGTTSSGGFRQDKWNALSQPSHNSISLAVSGERHTLHGKSACGLASRKSCVGSMLGRWHGATLVRCTVNLVPHLPSN